MELTTLVIGGIPVLLLVPGIVEAAKHFGVKGEGSLALSLILGGFFIGLAQAISQNAIPTPAVYWINIIVVGIGGGLALSGYYDLGERTGILKPK